MSEQLLKVSPENGERRRPQAAKVLSVTLISGDVLGSRNVTLPIRGNHELGLRVERQRGENQLSKDELDAQLLRAYIAQSEIDEDTDVEELLGKNKRERNLIFEKRKEKVVEEEPQEEEVVTAADPKALEKPFSFESPKHAKLSYEEMRIEEDKNFYINSCQHYRVPPVSYFIRHMYDETLELRHHGLGDSGIKPICLSLISNSRVHGLDVADNGIGPDGGIGLWDMLSENIFITHLDLSKNPLGSSAAYLSKMETAMIDNSQIIELNLSCTDLNDDAAPYLAKIISRCSKLEVLTLSHNRLGELAGQMIGMAIADNITLATLDVSWNAIRGKGLVCIFEGLRSNVGLRKLDLSWNGFDSASEAQALSMALKENSYLQELSIASNRVTPEHAVLIGKGLCENSTLQTLQMGKNPLRSAGCYAICNALLKNPEPSIRQLDFINITVNNDFLTILQAVKEKLPDLVVKYGPEEVPLKPRAKVSALLKLLRYLNKVNVKVNEFFEKYDQDGSMSLTHDEFRVAVDECGINMTTEEIDELIAELDRDGDGDINYTEMMIGSASMKI